MVRQTSGTPQSSSTAKPVWNSKAHHITYSKTQTQWKSTQRTAWPTCGILKLGLFVNRQVAACWQGKRTQPPLRLLGGGRDDTSSAHQVYICLPCRCLASAAAAACAFPASHLTVDKESKPYICAQQLQQGALKRKTILRTQPAQPEAKPVWAVCHVSSSFCYPLGCCQRHLLVHFRPLSLTSCLPPNCPLATETVHQKMAQGTQMMNAVLALAMLVILSSCSSASADRCMPSQCGRHEQSWRKYRLCFHTVVHLLGRGTHSALSCTASFPCLPETLVIQA